MTPIKLTQPQETLLRELANGPPRYVMRSRSTDKLVHIGCITRDYYGVTAITEAGREWIKERDAK